MKNVGRSVTNFIPISNRVLLMQVQLNQVNINIIQIYASTADKSEEEVDILDPRVFFVVFLKVTLIL